MQLQQIRISDLKDGAMIRTVKEHGVNHIKSRIEKSGYVDNFPILVSHENIIVDGHHRVKACIELGIEFIPAIVKTISGGDLKKASFAANSASETLVPMTFVDHAEFIWGETGTQQETADILGWGVSKVKNYSSLKTIKKDSWKIIVTTFLFSEKSLDSDSVTTKVTDVTFNEGLLRLIVNLSETQQLQLVTDFADGSINKNKFKVLAEKYLQQNKDADDLIEAIGAIVSEELLEEALVEIEAGNYNLADLIKLTLDKHNKITSIRLVNGDFYEEVKKVDDASIDLIITDPPYNIANENEKVFEGRKNRSNDFGEWDKLDHEEFKKQFDTWAQEFNRILTDNGSGYIFTSDPYISHIREALERAGLRYRATLVWHKTNPGTSVTKGNFISSVEYICYFSKEKPVLNWFGENEMHNFFESPLCAGNERLKDSKGNTLHPTQKPESVIKHLMEISSNKGGTVFDGFMGVGTVASVAKKTDRRFIGIEQDATFFAATQRRIK